MSIRVVFNYPFVDGTVIVVARLTNTFSQGQRVVGATVACYVQSAVVKTMMAGVTSVLIDNSFLQSD